MTLAELSTEYEISAGLISGRLAELRLALRQEGDAEAACRLRRRIDAAAAADPVPEAVAADGPLLRPGFLPL